MSENINLVYFIWRWDAKAFEKYGKVIYSNIMRADDTGNPLGFGFVGMVEDDEADTAIENLDDSNLNGNRILVHIAYLRMGKRRSGKERRIKITPNFKINQRTGKVRRSSKNRRKRSK